MNFQINVLSQSDWREYRDIRLKSLLDSPDSFGSTYERESTFSPEHWKSRLTISPTIHDAIALAAIADESLIGLVSAVIHEPTSKSAHLYQMWVAPEFRGKGAGTQLITNIKSWAVERGLEKIQLSVTTTNLSLIHI